MIIITDNIGRSENYCYFVFGIIPQCIGGQHKLRVHQLHIMVEYRLFCCRAIFAPIGGQYILFIHQSSPFEIISEIVETVVVQAVRQQGRVPVNHLHVFTKLRNLRHSVIIKIITIDEQGISLFHTHIAEGFYGVGFLKNQCTVTVHIHTVMAQLHVTNQHLHIRTCQLIRLSFVSMEQVNFGLFILRLLLVVRLFLITRRRFGFGSRLRRIRSRFCRSPCRGFLSRRPHLCHKTYTKQA